MKKTAKIVSALLVLVLMMAQVVCVSAATTAYVSITAKQTDHYEKTVTASFTNASKVTEVNVSLEDADGKQVNTEKHTFDKTSTFSLSVKVRPTEVSKVIVTYKDNGEEVKKTFTVGQNGYYDINSGSGSTSNNGVYDGLVSSGSSNNGNYCTVPIMAPMFGTTTIPMLGTVTMKKPARIPLPILLPAVR